MKTLLCVFFKFKILKKALEHYIVKSPICKLYYKWKIIWKVWSIFVGQKFTGSSDESEVSHRGERGRLVKISPDYILDAKDFLLLCIQKN